MPEVSPAGISPLRCHRANKVPDRRIRVAPGDDDRRRTGQRPY
ncbi:hypothetical protein VZC37_09570 [Gordonia sp. LSe1-13]|uniref:Uncharacterized protein n=1 Tax=Gordonia sesuvii TaxID=3116777 RepID=A0ABU7MC24_9ACTN|nr:hypothetical protein [Gordonia sp. LSe1-13]